MTNSVTEKGKSILKVTVYWILFLALLIPVTSQSGSVFSTHVHRFTSGIFGTTIALLVTWIFIKSEKRTFLEYNLVWQRDTFSKFLTGFGIGMASFSLITLILVLFGGLHIQKNTEAINPWIWLWYLAILPAAFMEEIAFRAYPFLKLKEALGLRLTQLIVLIAFALYHIPLGWSILTAFLGPGIWALIFGIAAIRSKGIALPTGIHAGLNLALSILGMGNGVESIFVTSQSESTSNTTVNLITRLLVLLAGILLTEFYIRRSKKENEKMKLERL